MHRDVTLHLDLFGQTALTWYSRNRRDATVSAVRTACLYYLADGSAGRAAWRTQPYEPDFTCTEPLKIGLDVETWRALEYEAHRQGVSCDALARHALLYFLADLAGGRMAAGLEDALDAVV